MAESQKMRGTFCAKRRRVVLTVQQKAKICEDFEKGLSGIDVSRKYNIPYSTAHDLKKNRQKLLKDISDNPVPIGRYWW